MGLQLKLIAAACENMGIGYKNKLPWKLPKEMEYFTRMTTQTVDPEKSNAVIMGHKTWLSIPKKLQPLKSRINIVLSRQLKETPEKAHHLVNSFEECLLLLQSPLLCNSIESVWVIGGEQVYKEALQSPFCAFVYLTRINALYDCDTFFPAIPMDKFDLSRDLNVPEEMQEENDIQYKFEVYKRKTL